MGLGDLILRGAGRRWTISSGCSGILTFEHSARLACEALGCGSSVESLWACEKSIACQDELLAMRADWRPRELFGNYD